jgi:hypothetical protein
MSMQATIFAVAIGLASSAAAAPLQLATTSQGTVAYSFPQFSLFDALDEGSPVTFSTTASYDTRFIQHGPGSDTVQGDASFTITAGAVTLPAASVSNGADISIIRQDNPAASDGYDHSATYFTRITTESFEIYEIYQTISWKDDAYLLPDVLQLPETLALPAEHRFSTAVNLWLGNEEPSSQLGLFVEDFTLHVSAVPEPHTALMLLSGLALCYAARHRQASRGS